MGENVMCKVKANFGKKSWSLGELVEIVYPDDGLDRYRWFGRLLLEGKVWKFFNSLQKHLVVKASKLTKSWAQDEAIVSNFIDFLAKNSISSKSALRNINNLDEFMSLV